MTDEEIRKVLIKQRKRKLATRRIISLVIALAIFSAGGYFAGKAIGNKIYASEINGIKSVTEDKPLVNVAKKELGNKGGKPYWTWFGFDERVDWCALFVSWCENECGYIDAKVAPSFAYVSDGSDWFIYRDQWLGQGSTPAPGDLIFFDWDQDEARDHVGIVTAVVDDKVFTIEGNSSDRCRQKRYSIDDPVIYGYGQIVTKEKKKKN